MKLSQVLFFSILIAGFLSWLDRAQVPGNGTVGNPRPPSAAHGSSLSTPNQNPQVVPSLKTSVVPSPNRPVIPATQSDNSPQSMLVVAIVTGMFLSIVWRQFGIDSGVGNGELPSSVLRNLIREVEDSSGQTRNGARAKAKAWLLANGTSLGENEIFLAKAHFSYLLPAGWGVKTP